MLTAEQLSIQENQLHCVDKPRPIVIVVYEGSPLASLLCEVLSQELAPGYAQQLFANVPIEHPEQRPQPSAQFYEPEWIEPLTNREQEVLQLVAAGFSRREIAARLVISGNTVKTHLRNLYSKLGVNSQMQAVGKARALGLLENDPEFFTPLSIPSKSPFNVLPSVMAQPAI
jgi:ATP/maltotriose-dependent transcriptional regulator MalT